MNVNEFSNIAMVILGTLNFGVLAATLYWLWRYTNETEQMKQAMVTANEYARRPFINLYLRSGSVKDVRQILQKPHFAIRNVGSSTAYNIQIDPVEINGQSYIFFIDEANLILEAGGDQKPLDFWIRKGSATSFSIVDDPLESLKQILRSTKNSIDYVPMLIRYQNIVGEHFFSLFKFYPQRPMSSDFVIDFVASDTGKIEKGEINRLADKKERLRPPLD